MLDEGEAIPLHDMHPRILLSEVYNGTYPRLQVYPD
jgi:hypothetical protein